MMDKQVQKEIAELSEIIREKDGGKKYAKAQFNIGTKYIEEGNTEKAIEHWNKITRNDDKELFAKAQFNIGLNYDKQGNTEKATEYWNKIIRNDDKEVFARAQFNVGSNYHREGENEKAIQTWNKITRDDDKEKFAKAQFNIGTKYTEEGNTDKAIEHWNKITRNDDKEVFARAQLNIASQYANKKNFELAISIVEQIDINGNYHLLENINFFKLYLYFQLRKYEQALDIAKNIDINSENGYLALIYSRIIELNNSNNTNIEKYDNFFDVVSDIRKELFINFNERQFINNHERKLAHYTGLNVTNDLLKINPTSLRLNTINNVNDPTEGRLLMDIVNKDFDRPFDKERDYHAFISCFTLNHDHLNQFRLYGKSAGKEATGISLVFCSDFFSRELSFENISYFKTATNSVSKKDLESNLQTLNTHEETNIESKDIVSTDFASLNSHCGYTNEKDRAIEIPKLSKRPVFRCVYVDAESGFISIAQRDEMTFYKECTFDKIEESHETRIKRANDAWVNYQNEISKKENKIKSLIKDLKDAYDNIQSLKPNIKQQELIEDILLPIRYLFKHSAFHEEQECRMIHITTLHDELVQTDFDKKFMYINYSEDVKSNIKQVYIGSESSSYQPFIMKLLGQDKAKHVHISHSPFRNK